MTRLPRVIQARFVEHLNKLEKRGQSYMPTFKNVVDFLRDRADVI